MANTKAPHLLLAKGAIPVSSIPASDLEGVNRALQEKRAVLQIIMLRGRSTAFVILVETPSSASQTAETQ